ncbi:MAG: hypothetical protein JSU81_10020 [Candidatus Coatesbacteria bacterium]|nr:MAG: hypothetical protein JSU81_10020 [Candidatus Coatesbacteria bacterium]
MRIFCALWLAAAVAAATDLAPLGYELYEEEGTGLRLWLPPGYEAEGGDAGKRGPRITVTSPSLSWPEGELAGLSVAAFKMLPPEGELHTAAGVQAWFEEEFELRNLLPAGERELPAERLAAVAPSAEEGYVGRYAGELRVCVIYYVKAHKRVFLIALKWPVDNAAAAGAAERIGDSFSIAPPLRAPIPPPAGGEEP